ncbi:hypothetical protein [Burkholderia vietnamiensis]|uniref:hypothetical protein n=1 Tax=Burkholderia vietnamiensis TaxID=60552 RepID=UPI001CB22D12|nr:hypothetical protein [Burkholderia vietnamiensis]CAG9228763.1 hypothetical protein BVI1335_70092 [Burkholderia vietnamiensis]HDR9086376.1 hypothetical protein [Burkholderia vietnamiensis]
MKPAGFARIPRAEFLYPECQRCYYHNREPAICEGCESASQFEPADFSDTLPQRIVRIVRSQNRKEGA